MGEEEFVAVVVVHGGVALGWWERSGLSLAGWQKRGRAWAGLWRNVNIHFVLGLMRLREYVTNGEVNFCGGWGWSFCAQQSLRSDEDRGLLVFMMPAPENRAVKLLFLISR